MLTVAQLARAPDCGSGGRRFDPGRSAHTLGRSQVGKARDFDSRIRRFESCRPSQYGRLPPGRGSAPVGPLAQWQSIRLLSGVSLVRIQHGPPSTEPRCELPPRLSGGSSRFADRQWQEERRFFRRPGGSMPSPAGTFLTQATSLLSGRSAAQGGDRVRHVLIRPSDERLARPFRRCWLRLLRLQARRCDHFRFNNWPGPVPEGVSEDDAPHYPAYQIERWRAVSRREVPNPWFRPDGITLIGPLTPQVIRLLVQADPLDRVCAWFDVQLCRGDQVLFAVQDWGDVTVVDVPDRVWGRLRVPESFLGGKDVGGAP